MSPKTLGTIGFGLAAYWVLIVLAMHALESEFDPVRTYISDYALGDYGFLMQSAFIAVGHGIIKRC